MKKFLKTAILSLVLCFTFVFAACGDAVDVNSTARLT